MRGFPGSFDDAFWAGMFIGFLEDHLRACRRCGADLFPGEPGYELSLCPECLIESEDGYLEAEGDYYGEDDLEEDDLL